MSTPLAVITGAAGAIGTAVAGRLAAEGHRLLLVDRDEAVEASAARYAAAGACVADLAAPAGVQAVADRVRELGGAAVLVNNAGITRDGRIGDLSLDAFSLVVEVNLVAAMRLAFALGDDLVDGASVVNMSSRAGLGNFGQANYVASKAGLVGFTRALALRWAPRVRVNAVAPGLIDTPMTQAMPERVLGKLVASVPAGRMGTGDDIADAVAYLASPASSYVTGQLLIACGGRSLAA